jgi:hypothetical protein
VDATTTAALIVGAFLGFGTGYAYAIARRAWADYRTTRAAVPVLHRLAWRWSATTTVRGAAVGVAIVATLWLAVRGP